LWILQPGIAPAVNATGQHVPQVPMEPVVNQVNQNQQRVILAPKQKNVEVEVAPKMPMNQAKIAEPRLGKLPIDFK